MAVADAGIALEASGYMALSEREVHAVVAMPGRAAELLAALRVPGVPTGAQRGETLAVPVGARAVHWPDLVTVPPGGHLPAAVEVEMTPKPTAMLRTILRAYRHPQRRTLYLGTASVLRQLQDRRARTAGGSTASLRTSACSHRAVRVRAPADSCVYARSPPQLRRVVTPASVCRHLPADVVAVRGPLQRPQDQLRTILRAYRHPQRHLRAPGNDTCPRARPTCTSEQPPRAWDDDRKLSARRRRLEQPPQARGLLPDPGYTSRT
ncbi:hypothetical protein AB0N19_26440 [Streptomyces sp. NPDC051132]|uniref:hypothetical protein n=1 Tax=Streptomyces sp. NPDC051132 TaxID=3155667 RepID=UPI00341E5ABA